MAKPNSNKNSDSTEKRKVLLGVTGSIAAYKSAELCRLLVTWGYEVRVIMSESACEFITPMTLAVITGNPVCTTFWDEGELSGIGHIELADWADVLIVAPATADFIAKLAAGFSDSPLLAAALATKAPILLAPAMNVNMWNNPRTKANLDLIKESGTFIIPPEKGDLACGWNGEGRLANPQEIFFNIRRALSSGDYVGKNLLITTGATREPIDPVRYLTNRSSGKMGIALAREAFRRGASITMIHGPITSKVPSAVQCIPVLTAEDMQSQVIKHVKPNKEGLNSLGNTPPDIVIMAAAVSDFRPLEAADHKIKKSDASPVIRLTNNPDILLELGELRKDKPEPRLVGFAVETGELEDLLNEARQKLSTKHADMIVGNFAQDAFDLDTNRVWLIDKHGRQSEVATTYKSRVANKILDAILKL